MKKALKIILGIVAAIAVLIATIFYFTSGMTDTADAFFNSVKQKDIAKARSYLSEDFKASTDEAALKAFLSKGAILNFKEASWSERSINGGRGELNGSITTESGGVVPIKLTFVKENDDWKIYAIQKPTAGLQSQEASQSAPSKAEQITLVKQSMKDFAAAINGKNMESFRKTLSKLWQKQVTTDQLNQVFASFIENGVDLTVLEPLDPSFDSESKIDENGVLIIKGRYPTKPSQLTFEHKYIYEGTAWKLVGFKVDIK